MDLSAFETLLTPAGQAALAEAAELGPSEETFLADLTRLQKRQPPALAKAALETVILRAGAQRKFSRAGQMYFSREALEQSSGERVARYRGARYAGFGAVGDLACGLGGDALVLADTGPAHLTLVDVDPLRLALAQANLAACGHAGRATFVCADLTSMPLPRVEALWFDPARREQGRRVFSVNHYHPPTLHYQNLVGADTGHRRENLAGRRSG